MPDKDAFEQDDVGTLKLLSDKEITEYLELAEGKQLWNYRETQICDVLESYGTKGENVNIAVIDSGFDYNHAALDNVVKGRNFVVGQWRCL